MNIEIFTKIQELEHEIFMNNCNILKNCLKGKNIEELEEKIKKQEKELERLRRNLYEE